MSLGSICGPMLLAMLVLGGHAVDEPAELVSTAHVQHVVCDVGAGHVVGDHGKAVGAVGSRRVRDRFAAYQRGWSDGVGIGDLRLCGYLRGLLNGGEGEWEVKNVRGVGGDGQRLLAVAKPSAEMVMM